MFQHHRPRAAVTAVLAATLCLACAPPGRSTEPGVLVVSESEQTASFVRNFNPLVEAGNVRWPTRRAMYEPLLVFNSMTGEMVPWLATSYRWSADSKQLRLQLRRGVRWSDGAPFGAADVVFTLELLRRYPALDSRGLWGFVAAVRSVGDHEVEIDLARPYVPGIEDLGHQPIVPAHVWASVTDPVAWNNPEPVATGPFTEVVSFRGPAYQVARNPHYWGGTPAVTALRFLAFPGNESANLALIRGEVDWSGNFVPAIDRVYVARDREHHRYWFPLVDGTIMLYLNTRRAPFDDVRVRKAISMAIDRERVVRIAMFGYTRPADATGLSDLYARYRSPEVAGASTWTGFDRERAGALLDAAGIGRDGDGNRRLPGGERFGFTIVVPAGFSDWVRAANVLARSLREVGIDASFRSVDYNTWYDKLSRGGFEASLGWTVPTPTPYGFYRNLMSAATVRPAGEVAASNWQRFASAEADRVLAELERATDPGDQARLYRALQERFAADAPAIPLFPGPMWSEFNTARFEGFPDQADPYAAPSPNAEPQTLLVLRRLVPR